MKKSSLIFATSIMTLALIVAIVGVTAAWFGDIFEYRSQTISVTSTNPENNAIIVPDSTSDLPTGSAAELTPARLREGYGLSDVDGSGKYDDIEINVSNGFGKDHPAIEKPAVPVTVTFDFVYNGAASNTNGTTRMKIELVSITTQNPIENDLNGDGLKDGKDATIFLRDHIDYRAEFGIEMFITTTSSEVMGFNDSQKGNQPFYTIEGEGKNVYYRLKSDYYYYEPIGGGDLVSTPSSSTNPYALYFDFIPYTHTLNATIHFLKVDEETAPELIGAQLFLNFQVAFLAGEGGNNNEN